MRSNAALPLPHHAIEIGLTGGRARSGISGFACAASLEQHPAGVEAESGHVVADLALGGDGFGAGAGVGLAEQEGAGEQEAAGEPCGFFPGSGLQVMKVWPASWSISLTS